MGVMGLAIAVHHEAQEWVHPVEAALSLSVRTPRGEQTLALVVHGMMGQRGPVPTEVVVHAARAYMRGLARAMGREGAGWTPEGALDALLDEMHGTLLGLPRVRPHWGGIGASVAAAWFAEGQVVIAHAGDCRVYRHRQGEGLAQLTVDHTLLEDVRRQGALSPEQLAALKAPQFRNVLVRVLGLEHVPRVAEGTPKDGGGASPEEPPKRAVPWEMRSEAVLPGDVYLLGTGDLEPQVVEACVDVGAPQGGEAALQPWLARLVGALVATLEKPPKEVACAVVQVGGAGAVDLQEGRAGAGEHGGAAPPSPEERYAGMGVDDKTGKYTRLLQEG